jgi:hypothetical protein
MPNSGEIAHSGRCNSWISNGFRYALALYKDQTFCCALVHKSDCQRQFTDEDAKSAERWWGGSSAPVAWRNFCGGPDRNEPTDQGTK